MGSSIIPRRPNSILYPNQGSNRSRRRNGSPPRGNRQDGSEEARVPANKLINGQVKILKRGEPLSVFLGSKAAESGYRDLGLGSGRPRRLGPDFVPVMVQRKVHFSDEYAGPTVFLQSPPPSSVPVPCFLGKSRGC